MRTKIKPNDQALLWKAVKIAKNISITGIPKTIKYNNKSASNDQNKADIMMDCFEDKIKNITSNLKISNRVNNGRRTFLSHINYNRNTNEEEINKLLKSMVSKNCSGYDRIPMSFLVDGRDELLRIISTLFNKILLFQTY